MPMNQSKATGKGLMKVFLFVLVVFASGTVQGRDIPRFRIKEEKAREYFVKGVSFFNKRKYNAAREFFYKALNVQPSFHLARIYLGNSYYYSGEWNGALEQWEYLNDITDEAYPLIRQTSDLLRFRMSRHANPGDYTLYKTYGPNNIKESGFQNPVDIYIDPVQGLYILNYGSRNILNLDPTGVLIKTWRGSLFDSLEGPISFAKWNKKYYISDYSADMIRVLNMAGREVATIGKSGSGPGEFRGPGGVTLTDNAIFVADTGNSRIQKFDHDGEFLQEFYRYGKTSKLKFPFGMATDGEGTLFVSDTDAGVIVKFDEYGNYLGKIEGDLLSRPRGLSCNDEYLIVADEKSGVLFYNRSQKSWEKLGPILDENLRQVKFNRPYAARLDRSGILYVSEYSGNRVDILVPRGLRTSNLDVSVESVETGNYPNNAIFVTVKNRLGIPVRDLGNRSFTVYENDRRVGLIRSDNMRTYNNRVNMVFVREDSTSMNNVVDSRIYQAAKRIVDPIRIVDTLKVIRAGKETVSVYEGLERKVILKRMGEGFGKKDPNLGKALFQGITDQLGKKGSRNVILFASGAGFYNAFNQYSLERVKQYARAHDVAIHVISFGKPGESKAGNLKDLAESTSGLFIMAHDDTAMKGFYDEMRNRKDNRYILTYRSKKERNISGRFVDVRVDVKYIGTSGVGEGGYFAP